MNVYERFRADLTGWDVEDYEPRAYDARPAVRADDEQELQDIIRATQVIVTWDTLGMGYIVYPKDKVVA